MWNFNKILGISSIQVINFIQDKERIVFIIKSRRKTNKCPHCQRKIKTIRSLSAKRTIKNGTIFEKLCFIKIKLKRFYCKGCKKAFTERISFLKQKQRSTLNHKKEVIFNLVNQSFSANSKKYHVSYPTQRRWLEQLIEDKIFDFSKEERKQLFCFRD